MKMIVIKKYKFWQQYDFYCQRKAISQNGHIHGNKIQKEVPFFKINFKTKIVTMLIQEVPII